MASSSLGLTFKITPQVAEDLRRRNNELTDSKNVKDPVVVTTATNETSGHDPTTTVHSSSGQTNHTSSSSSPDEPRIPVVLVDFLKFVGYCPSSEEDALQLQRDIRQACFATGAFDARIAELLDSGSAAYELEAPKEVTVSTTVARIPYPPTIQDPRSDRQFETAVLYKTLEKRHPQIPILNRIYQNLWSCRRSLLWKYDLHTCLWDLAESELQEKQAIAHQLELYHWRTKRRSQELTQLYQVRETFQHRLEMAQIRLEKLEEERHVKMQQVLLEPEHGGGLGALDFQTSHFHFPERPLAGKELLSGLQHGSDDDQENDVFQVMVDDEIDQPGFDNLDEDEEDLALPLIQEAENFPEENFPDTPPTQEVDYDSDYFCDEEDAAHRSDDEGAAEVNDDDLAADLPRGKSTRRRRRRTKKTKAQREKEAAVVDHQQKDEEYRQRLEQAYEEEDRVRELCTTPELRKAQAVVASLEQRAQRVEDLLESLQEEEWEDEETGVPKPVIQTTQNHGHGEMSLLDQILAMILGRLPPKDGTSMEEHYQYVQEQHQSIVQEWKCFFGRLPSSLTPAEGQPRSADQPSVPTPTSAELRMALGIEENESEDWESGYLDDDFDGGKEQQAGIAPKLSVETPPEPKPSPPKGGLRPGGSVGLRPGGRV